MTNTEQIAAMAERIEKLEEVAKAVVAVAGAEGTVNTIAFLIELNGVAHMARQALSSDKALWDRRGRQRD